MQWSSLSLPIERKFGLYGSWLNVSRTFVAAVCDSLNKTPCKPDNVLRTDGYTPHCNLQPEYFPPKTHERLKDAQGKQVRPRAQKAIYMLSKLLVQYTDPGDLVFDSHAGEICVGCGQVSAEDDCSLDDCLRISQVQVQVLLLRF
jgi:hypothetical protein